MFSAKVKPSQGPKHREGFATGTAGSSAEPRATAARGAASPWVDDG